MRSEFPKGLWEKSDGLFDVDIEDWREIVPGFLRQGDGNSDSHGIGEIVRDLALGSADLDDVLFHDHDHDHDGTETSEDIEVSHAPPWKDGGDIKSGKGGGNGKGANKGEDSGATDGGTTDGGSPDGGSTDGGSTDDTFSSGAPQYAIDAILSGRSWGEGPVTVTYAFMESLPSYYSAGSKEGFTSFNEGQREAALEIFDMLSQYVDVTFVETSIGESNLAFGNASLGGYAGYAYYPSQGATGTMHGDVWLDPKYASNPVEGNFGYLTIIHEIGHAMGLSHPHEGAYTLPAGEDTRQFTVESYKQHATMGGVEPQSYMTYDIAALQQLYGANTSWATGDDVYDFTTAHNLIETIWDAGGIDTFDASGRSDGVYFNLDAGEFSSVGTRATMPANQNIAIAYGVTIENAIGGGGNDVIVGNASDNVMSGGGGDDHLVGGGGSDMFRFDSFWGNDTIADFEDGIDILDFTGSGLSYTDFSFGEGSSGAYFSFGANSLVMTDFAPNWLDEADFSFG